MADFKTHVTFSSVLGCGYSAAGMMAGVDPTTAIVAGGLCGVSGMLPDVDSDSGIPRRETMGFAAAIVPMLLVDRFQEMGLGYDEMVLAAATSYYLIRFAVSRLIGRFSVHRGMWHSIPAALIFAGLAFLVTGTSDLSLRYFKAFAVFLGAMSHLVLDEVYSVDTSGVVPKFKKSFGTAVKFWGKNPWANFSTYAKLAVVVIAILCEPAVMHRLEERHPGLAGRIDHYAESIRDLRGSARTTQETPSPSGGFLPNSARGLGPPIRPQTADRFGSPVVGYPPDGRPASSSLSNDSPGKQGESGPDRTIYDTARRLLRKFTE